MSTTLTIILNIAGIALVGAAILFIIFAIYSFISDHAALFFRLLQILLSGIVLCLCAVNNEIITLYLIEHQFIPFLIIAVANVVFFFIMPRKALVFNKNTHSREIYHKTTHYINLNTGNFGSYGGGSSTRTIEDFTLYGGGDPTFDTMDEIEIYANFASGKHSILRYNRLGKYGVMEIPDWWITRIPVFIIPFTSSVWLLALGQFGTTAPLIMHILLFTSLWFVFYDKKIYFSLAHAKAHGANKIIFGISIFLDIIICIFNMLILGRMQSLYLEAFGIYILFILVSTIWFFAKHKYQ